MASFCFQCQSEHNSPVRNGICELSALNPGSEDVGPSSATWGHVTLDAGRRVAETPSCTFPSWAGTQQSDSVFPTDTPTVCIFTKREDALLH
jgi:hypothetical protein